MFALMNTSSGAQNRIGVIASGSEAVPGYPFRLVEVDGIPISISVSGPVRGSVVVMLTALPTPYDAVCQRLHIAVLRTVVIVPDRRMNAASVAHILDLLGVQSALLVGDWAGGELAWELSATRPDRFTGFVVIDVGHPRVADLTGVIRNDACPPVGINTTALVSTPHARAVANASQRYVHGDFRLVNSCVRSMDDFVVQLAAEIVLRTASW